MKNKENNTTAGVIYILTNPSFPNLVKIGYADNVERRLKELNRSECIPFAFRLYAYYKVPVRLTSKKLHRLINKLDNNLHPIEDFNNKERADDFYAMDVHDAYSMLKTLAEIINLKENLVLVKSSKNNIKKPEEIRTKRSVTQLPKMDWLIEQGIIQIGDEIYVINHIDEVATIKDSKNVLYKGKKMTFSKFGCKVTGWKSINIYAWMKIKGNNDVLSNLREKRMRELGMIE